MLYGEAGTDLVRKLLTDAERARAVVYLSAVSLCEIVSTLIKTRARKWRGTNWRW